MKLLVLGATGGIGIEIVRQAITRGHAVTTFVRAPERLRDLEGRISIATGDVLNAAELARVMRGQDAVLSAFGPRVPIAKTDTHLLRHFAAALTDGMKKAEVRRLMPPAYLFGRLFFPGVVVDATGMEATLRASGLDIAIVRPPQLTDKPHTGKIRVRDGHLPAFGFSIPRADVAEFMIGTAEDGGFARSVVGISS